MIAASVAEGFAVSHQYAASSANRRQEIALKVALGVVTLPQGVSNGECRIIVVQILLVVLFIEFEWLLANVPTQWNW